MRRLIPSAAACAILAGLSACAQVPGAQRPSAVSAEGHATPAIATEPEFGYSDDARHIADCLAAHRSYDYRSDKFRTYSGHSRRCAPTAREAPR